MNTLKQEIKINFRSVNLTNESGFTLATILILMMVLALLFITGTQWASQDISRTAKYRKSKESFNIAEAGIQQAINFLDYDNTGDSPGAAGNGFDDELVGTTWPAGFASTSFGGGTYSVFIDDNDDNDTDMDVDIDNTVVITSSGTIKGYTTQLEAVVSRLAYDPEYAIIVEGDFKATSNTSVLGGDVHTNSIFTQTGTPDFDGTVTASGTCAFTLCYSAGGEPKQQVPWIEPSDVKSAADYVFNSDGTIDRKLADGTYQTGVEGESIFDDFSLAGTVWKITNDADVGVKITNQATLYVEGGFNGKTVGDAVTPWEVSIIVETDIKWTTNAFIKNWKDPSLPPDMQNLFLIAGNDININSLKQDTTGIISAKDQFSIGGTATLTGVIFGGSLTTNSIIANGTESDIHGDFSVTFDASMIPPVLSDKVTIISWRSL